MRTLLIAVSVALLNTACVGAQVSSDLRALLASQDPSEREAAFRQLTSGGALQPDAKSALVGPLDRENAVVKAAFLEGPGASEKYGEGYGEYVGFLNDAVMRIADAEPDRSDVWHALLGVDPGPGDTAYGKWLGTHGDKVLPYLLAYAADRRSDDWDKNNRADALKSLAQVIAHERRSETAHHLSAKELQTVETLVQTAVDDADVVIRMAAVTALEIIGDPGDLPTLDRIAFTDEYVEKNGGRSGAETRFPVRDYARAAAERMRAKLAAKSPVTP